MIQRIMFSKINLTARHNSKESIIISNFLRDKNFAINEPKGIKIIKGIKEREL
jgi:hypothetical protein